jgi:CBS domain-containing protein
VKCPDCGHENLDGVNDCEHCGQDLSSLDIPRARSGLQKRIIETPLRDLNPAPALTVAPGEPIASVIAMMQKHGHGSVLILDGGRLVGIFTERDVLNRLTGRKLDLDRTPVSRVMTRDPKSLRETDTLAFAMHRMAVGSYRHIPIIREGKPPAFVSVRGVLRYLHEHAR